MARKVVHLRPVNLTLRNRIQANRVLRSAVAAKLAKVVVIGERDDGRIYMASSDAPETVMWDLEYAKKWLLDGCPEQDA
jgi:hypothetical protein